MGLELAAFPPAKVVPARIRSGFVIEHQRESIEAPHEVIVQPELEHLVAPLAGDSPLRDGAAVHRSPLGDVWP